MLLENIKEALQNLSANRMRSLLTMLGIIIGITAVITITTIGASIKSTINNTFNSLLGNSIEVYVDAVYPENEEDWLTWEYPEMEEEDGISNEMIEELAATYPDEIMGSSMNNYIGNGAIQESADKYANVSVVGCNEGYLTYRDLDIIRGRSITDRDVEGAKRVAIVSDTMVSYYFGEEDPIGQTVDYVSNEGKTMSFTIVGVYEYDEAKFGRQDTTVPVKDRYTDLYIPYTAGSDVVEEGWGDEGISYATILLQPGADKSLAKMEIEDFFAQKYADNPDWHVTTYDMSEDLSMIDTVINVVTVAISFIAAISLIVGGVGVMNIMLVSITERTKEIGIRKALGATNKTIHQQFLIESVVLCLIGGIIGILLGILLGFILGKVAGVVIQNYYAEMADMIVMNVHPSAIAIILSVAFSMLIGIFFGSYPAKKAAKMEVIDALRYE